MGDLTDEHIEAAKALVPWFQSQGINMENAVFVLSYALALTIAGLAVDNREAQKGAKASYSLVRDVIQAVG